MRSSIILLVVIVLVLPACSSDETAFRTWRSYGGDPTNSRNSSLDQINRENVHRLEVAWIYRTGDASEEGRTQIQCNPIIVDSVLYATSPMLKAFALHAATGEEIWTFEPFSVDSTTGNLSVNRGVMYWEDGDDKRILYTAGPSLYALDARTGKPIPSFGNGGVVNLHEGLGRDTEGLFIAATSPGVIYRDLLILGARVSEGHPAAPGHIRAFNVRTGEIKWIFHTIPRPGEYGYDTWPPDAWQEVGGANSWSGMSLDEERGIVYIPTGSAAFDFWGGNRHGQNLFANSILALDAATGKRIWHFQTVRHDIWDRDLPAPPNLVTLNINGRRVDALAQITKSGHVFVLDRETGEPLFPIEEREYPRSELMGEMTWPTQPLPVKPPPFARQEFREEDITDISPESHAYVLERFRQVRSGGQFVPPSLEGTIIFPGFDGGGEWGGAAFDPETGLLYVNANEMPWILTMFEIAGNEELASGGTGRQLYATNCAACHGMDRLGDGQTYPSLLAVEERYTRKDVSELIRTGKGVMPSFGYLSERQRDALVDYLFNVTRADHHGEKVEVESSVIPYGHTGYNRFLDQNGYPAVKPPWGTLNAIDLNRGEIAWTVTLGEFPELTARGIPPTGTENYGGPVVTAGGLVFIGATKDEKFRAFDKETGELLWETELPAGGYATPSTYEVNGKQYVVIAAGGGKMGTKSGDAYVAFALPD